MPPKKTKTTKSTKSAKSKAPPKSKKAIVTKPAKADDIDYGDEEPDEPEDAYDDFADGVDVAAINPNELPQERYEYLPELHKEIVYVHPENRITSEIMTKFEFTDVISQRAKQIENGSICYTDTNDITDPIELAKKEIFDKKCPLDIRRMLTDKIAEVWHVNEMAIPDF